MATRADSTTAPISRRRPAALSAAPRRRRGAALPAHLAHLAPLLRNRERIEALVEQLIALLDALDTPLADMEPDADGEAEPAEASLQPVERRLASNVIQFPKARRVKIDWPAVPLPISDEVLPQAREDAR